MSIKRTLSVIMVGACCLTTNAQKINLPVVQTKYTADPAPMCTTTPFICTPPTMKTTLKAST